MKPTNGQGRDYKDWIERSSLDRCSRVILGLNIDDGHDPAKSLADAQKLLAHTSDYICAVRFGRQTVLNLGTSRTAKLASAIHRAGLPNIIDDKLSDIDVTNEAITRAYFHLGFDATIVNPSPGWKGGLQPVFRLAHSTGHGVIVLTYMSNPGARDTFGRKLDGGPSGKPLYQYQVYANRAVEWEADGAVVGATRPKIIRSVKPILKDSVPVYSPGVGSQGGDVARARRAGADYFIISRSIMRAEDPEKTARKLAKESTL